MQCRDAQFYLRLRRHAGDELGAEVVGDLNRHLAGCPACGADAAVAASFDRAVASALRAVPVPPNLRDRLLAQASAYRGSVIRHRAYRVAALAASVFVGVGLALGLFAGRPKLATDEFVARNDEQTQQPELALERWLADLGAPARLPHAFDPGLLVFLGKERVQGKDVPVAVFRHRTDPREFAKVYVLRSDGPFDTREARNAGISNHVAEVVTDEKGRVTYVILYKNTPDGLRPFLANRNGGPPAT